MRYTSLLEPMLLIRRYLAALLLFSLIPCGHSQTASPSVWTRPARLLVQELLEKAGSPSSVSISIENRAALRPEDQQQIRKAVDDEFRAARVRILRMESAVAEVKVTLSRNAAGLLWIAQVKQGTSEQVSMVAFADPSRAAGDLSPALFQLQREPLLSRPAAILDVAFAGDALVVLGGEQLSLYPRGVPNATATASVLIAHSKPWPRDLRGRVFVTGDAFAAHLPGVHCTGSVRPVFAGRCTESDDPWPLLPAEANPPAAFYGSARNHFSGALGGAFAGSEVPAFFAAARLGASDDSMWAFSGIDGNTRLYIRIGQLLRTVGSLGSDLAAVRSSCGASWQLLVSGDGDATAPDTLQAYEFRNLDARVVSEKARFGGPITALWTAGQPERAIVVVRDLEKEAYEAYSVSLDCGR